MKARASGTSRSRVVVVGTLARLQVWQGSRHGVLYHLAGGCNSAANPLIFTSGARRSWDTM